MADFEHRLTRNLQCPICIRLLTDPKQLSCMHTFCETCLQRLLSLKPGSKTVSCPVCRRTTSVGNGGVSSLPTNKPLKAIALDVKESGQQCGICDVVTKAVFYCRDCEQMMCKNCRGAHDTWKPNARHKVVIAADATEDEVVQKRRVCCNDQRSDEGIPKQEYTDVCITCQKFICIACRMPEHEKRGHVVKSAVDYQYSFLADVNSFQEKSQLKVANIRKHNAFVKTEKLNVIKHIDELSESITETHDEVIEKLKGKKEMLLRQCKAEKEKYCLKLDRMTEKDDQIATSIEGACDLVKKSCTMPLDGNTIIIRESLCDELKTALNTVKQSDSSVSEIANLAEKLEYIPIQNVDMMGHGKVHYRKLKVAVEFATVDAMNCMAVTPDGRLAVGYVKGECGIELYSADGQLQQKAIKGEIVNALVFLSDGRCVVRNAGMNILSVHSLRWDKLDVKFETCTDGGHGDLTVDSDDHIYVGYITAKKIHVFTPAGGEPIREIQCDKYSPMHMFTMKSSKMLVVKDFANSTRVIDSETGCTLHRLIEDVDVLVFSCLSKDDTILVATLNKDPDRVTISHYTSELKHMSTLVTDHVIVKLKRKWCYLQVTPSGEIAFCTPDRLYIFYDLATMIGENL